MSMSKIKKFVSGVAALLEIEDEELTRGWPASCTYKVPVQVRALFLSRCGFVALCEALFLWSYGQTLCGVRKVPSRFNNQQHQMLIS